MSEREKWLRYEAEKKKIQNKGLSPSEYEAAIRALAKRLGI